MELAGAPEIYVFCFIFVVFMYFCLIRFNWCGFAVK